MLDEVELQLLKMIIDSKVELPLGNGNILGKIKNIHGGVIFATGKDGCFYSISHGNAKKILEYTEEKRLISYTSLSEMIDAKNSYRRFRSCIFPYNTDIDIPLQLLISIGYSPSEEDIFGAWCCDTSEILSEVKDGMEGCNGVAAPHFEGIEEVAHQVQSHAEVWENKALQLYNLIDNHLSDKYSTKEDLDSKFRSIVNYFKNNQEEE